MMKHSRRSRGFTLAELLIVVAIVAVLAAIAIPVFAHEMEKSREATDTANIRDQYAEVMAQANVTQDDVNVDGDAFEKVQLRQKNGDWQSAVSSGLEEIAAFDGEPAPGGYAWVSFSRTATNNVTIHFTGGGGSVTPAQPTITPQPTTQPTTSDTPTLTQTLTAAGWSRSPFTSFDGIKMDKGKNYKLALDKVDYTGTFVLVASNGGGNDKHAGKTEITFTKNEPVNFDIAPGTKGNNFRLEIVSISGMDDSLTLAQKEALLEQIVLGGLYQK